MGDQRASKNQADLYSKTTEKPSHVGRWKGPWLHQTQPYKSPAWHFRAWCRSNRWHHHQPDERRVSVIPRKTVSRASQDLCIIWARIWSAHFRWGLEEDSRQYGTVPEEFLHFRNLFTNRRSEFNVSGAEIKNTKSYITGSTADMQSLLVDVGENVPKEEGAFMKVEDKRMRADCNFQRVCELIWLEVNTIKCRK